MSKHQKVFLLVLSLACLSAATIWFISVNDAGGAAVMAFYAGMSAHGLRFLL
jgi:hypothetical protein